MSERLIWQGQKQEKEPADKVVGYKELQAEIKNLNRSLGLE